MFDKQANNVVSNLTLCKHSTNGIWSFSILRIANCANATHRASAVPEMNIITLLSQLIDTTKRRHIMLHLRPCEPLCRDQQESNMDLFRLMWILVLRVEYK